MKFFAARVVAARVIAALLCAVGIIVVSGVPAQASGYFGGYKYYNQGGALISVTAEAYGNNSVTWYGTEKIAVSRIYTRTHNYGGSSVSAVRLKPIVDFYGYDLTADSSGAFGVGPYTDSCARSSITEYDRSVTYQHDGVACTGSASDITSVAIVNQAAVRFSGIWYGYTVRYYFNW